MPHEAASRRDRLRAPVHRPKDHEPAERAAETLEERARQHGRAEAAHVACKHFVERRKFSNAEPGVEAVPLRAPDLTAQLRGKRAPHGLARGGQLESHGELPLGEAERRRHQVTGTQFEQIHAEALGERRRVVGERRHSVGRAHRPAAIKERQRDEIVPEERAAHANERQDAAPHARIVARDGVEALVPQHVGHHVAPSGEVAERAPRRRRYEGIPHRNAAVKQRDGHHTRAMSVRRASVSAIAVKRNSTRSRSSRGAVRRKPP